MKTKQPKASREKRIPFSEDLDAIHRAGAKRHPQHWLHANRVAIDAMRICGVEPSASNELKCGLSLAVLYILNGTD